ncbi:MAG: ABC transporter substrate-binding protein [Chloroflexota bacterium]|nr:ABC transporter substrate-binding protein [Chloroflexota bacterium]
MAIHESAPLSIVRLAVNTTQAPLDRVEVRQAIAHALDRQRIAEAITRGPAIVGSAGVVPPETPWFNPNLPEYAYDPDRARELLGGEHFTIDLVADARAREPDLMVPMLEEVGITLNVQRVDSPTRIQLLRDGDFQLGFLTHIGVGGDPDYLRRWYNGEETNAYAQGSLFSNEEYTRLGEAQAETLDATERKELVYRMQEILAEQLPTIVLYHRRFYWMYDPARFMPMETWGGLMNGIPFPHNKLALIAN